MKPLTDLTSWLDYIEALHPLSIDLGLERVRAVADKILSHQLANRFFSCPVVIIAGTNGKGSCTRFLESIYHQAGYRVGSYTSPHLLQFNERIRIAGQDVKDDLLLTAFTEVEQARGTQSLSFFEFTTLAALHLFQQANLDVVLLEVGLGGRLDAVNIVDADVSVVTTVDLDHTDWLGADKETIGREKAGIFRQQCPAVYGDYHPPHSLYQHAQQLQAPFYCLGKEFGYEDLASDSTWQWWSHRCHYQNLPPLSLKRQNAATSLMVIELLQDRLPVTEAAISQGLAATQLSGRFEVIFDPIFCILDVAHNPQAIAWLGQQLMQLSCVGKRIAIVGMLADKDIKESVSHLIASSIGIDSWYAVDLDVPRGAKASLIAKELAAQGIEKCYNFPSVSAAIQAITAENAYNSVNDQVIVFGSFYTVAAAKSYFVEEVK